MLNIATILPYKEDYTISKAGAASLWVADFFKHSKFKKNNIIFGNTKYKKKILTKNYINIPLSTKSRFSSTTIRYCDEIIKNIKKRNFEIIEIHNRPLVFNYLNKKIKSKFILYFHNDPLSMKGSESLSERIYLYNNVDKIIFVSKWVQKRFFAGMHGYNINSTEVVYPSIHKEKKIYNKIKRIVFVGKLNKSKGYDIYGEAISKILKEFKDWNSFSIGDEKREKPEILHKNHKELGYLKHKEVLNFFNKSEIAVVPSRWEEPFGRTALESSSRACATIISNRGGLPETTHNCLIVDKLNSHELYKKIKYLIVNKIFRRKLQKKAFLNVLHITRENSKFLDSIREKISTKYRLNLLNKRLRILNIYNVGQKLNHRLFNISLGKKFTNGFIRNNNDVLEISDRDFVKQNRSINFQSSYNKFQEYLLETYKNYNPNLVFFGHTDNISTNTLQEFRSIDKNVIISHWNEDPMMKGLNDSSKNISKLEKYNDYVDNNFITTDPSVVLKRNNKIKNLNFFFIPVDKNIESYDVYKMTPSNDIFYAMSHGVNRAILKKGKLDERYFFLKELIKKMDNIKYDFYGYENIEPVWGDKFYKALTNSKMGLNLSRGEPTRYYTSNRVASLVGNGLLTFIDKKTCLNEIFNNKEIIFYNNIEDLSSKIKFYKVNEKSRKKIAYNGKKKYFSLFNEKKISDFIVKKSFGKKVHLF